MGMTIDEAIEMLKKDKEQRGECFISNALDMSIDTMRKYQQLQADYENRLKADLLAMLTDIQLEIEENGIVDFEETYVDDGECIISVSECNRLIQEKINELKAESEDTCELI